MGQEALYFVMETARTKWKGFKLDLKRRFFDPTLTEELFARCGTEKRLNAECWKWLINYWMSPESEVRSAIGKMNRGKLRMLHTSGSKSHARVGYDMTAEQGRPARRDEVWIATHLHKNGVPTIQAASTVRELKAAAENHPELMERTIQEGDLFASVCGEKEPRGRVRCLGLGPTPQDVGTPGTQSKMPTRLQIEIACHQQTKKDFSSLNNRVDNMQQEMDQMKKMIQASQGMQNVELSSQHGSTSRHMSPPCEEHELANGSHDSDIEADCARLQAVLFNDNENIVHRRVIQRGTSVCVSATPRNHTSSCNEDESLVGKDVILYAVTRNDIPVAKATIVSTDPSATVGGQALGVQYYEVVVNVVLKRDTVLSRPYDGIETMADAYMLSIAWPNNKIRASKSPCISQCGGGGSGRT